MSLVNKDINDSCHWLICIINSLRSQIPVTTGGFELQISYMRSSYLTHFVCKRFAVQTLLWSLELVIQINLEHYTITV